MPYIICVNFVFALFQIIVILLAVLCMIKHLKTIQNDCIMLKE